MRSKIALNLGLILVLFMYSSTRPGYAVSAYPSSVSVEQPDGSHLTLLIHGSEKYHYTSTTDNYTIIQGSDGFYKYAIDSSGYIRPGKTIARNPAERALDERLYLNRISKNIMPRYVSPRYASRDSAVSLNVRNKIRSASSRLRSASSTTNKYLVILVNFSDKSFTKTNADFTNLLNQSGYSVNGATGSVKDYYTENSMNNFNPQFDVYGPVTLPHSMSYYGSNNSSGDDIHPEQMVLDACALIDAQYNVDFSQYDNDGDKYVDNVAIFFAGYAESSGAPAYTIWPHQYTVTYTTGVKDYDGVKLASYSCSSELKGISGTTIDGIGTFCHEFGHVLGLPDLYDTDGSTNGTFFDPNDFNLMASGNYNNNENTPPYLSIFEREILGWAVSDKLSTKTTVQNMQHIGASNQAYYFHTNPEPTDGYDTEWFYLENRQQTGWDAYIPGHGLVITHVDMSSTAISKYWNSGLGNAYSTHPCYDLMEADGTATYSTRAGDPFPGTSGRTYFTDSGTPNALSWAGVASNKPVTNITEADMKISFNFMDIISGGISTDVQSTETDNSIVIASSDLQISISGINDGAITQLFDISGKQIGQYPATGNKQIIPVTYKGIYILKISDSGKTQSYKVAVTN